MLLKLFIFQRIVSASDCSIVVDLWKYFKKSTIVDANDTVGCCNSDIPNITCNGSSVIKIDWSNLGLQGDIPASIKDLKELSLINFGNNLLVNIPNEISELQNLKNLLLYSNGFKGSIPSSILKIHGLKTLDLSNNKFSGMIPFDIMQLSNLEILSLSDNLLSGSIPSNIVNLTSLQQLFLSNNKLSEVIPSQIGSMNNLKYLRLDGNQFSGKVPCTFSNLLNLNDLNLQDNPNLSGIVWIGSSIKIQTIKTKIKLVCTPDLQKSDPRCQICGYSDDESLESAGISMSPAISLFIWILFISCIH